MVAIHGTSTATLRLLGALPRLRQVSPSPRDPVLLANFSLYPSFPGRFAEASLAACATLLPQRMVLVSGALGGCHHSIACL